MNREIKIKENHNIHNIIITLFLRS